MKSHFESNLDKPQYNSTLKLINKLDQLNSGNPLSKQKQNDSFQLDERQIEQINEKASSKLNMQGRVFGGLVSVEPDEEDFIKFLEIKHKNIAKPQLKSKSDGPGSSLMEFYPVDLIKEYPEIEIEPLKTQKLHTMKAALSVANSPLDNYFKWN